MKITLDKTAFTLAEKDTAKEFMAEWNWITDEEIESAARQAVRDLGTGYKMIHHGPVICCKDHFEPCLYVEDVVLMGFKEIVVVGLNLTDAINTPCENRPKCFRRIYSETKSECV